MVWLREWRRGTLGFLVLSGVVLGFLLRAGWVHAGGFGDPRENWVEGPVEFPAGAVVEDMHTISVSAASRNRFALDPSGISVGEDGVVRYVLMVDSAGGARTITFEGIHCASQEVKIYAIGREDGTWQATRDPQWRVIQGDGANRVHAALSQDYFCDLNVPPRDRSQVMRRLGL